MRWQQARLRNTQASMAGQEKGGGSVVVDQQQVAPQQASSSLVQLVLDKCGLACKVTWLTSGSGGSTLDAFIVVVHFTQSGPLQYSASGHHWPARPTRREGKRMWRMNTILGPFVAFGRTIDVRTLQSACIVYFRLMSGFGL